MKRIILIGAVCACGLLPSQAQGVDEVLKSVERHNKSIQAQRKNGEAEKIGIDAENGLEDPTVEYSSFYSRDVRGQSSSELVVTQEFEFPSVYGSRGRAGRDKKEAVDYRAEVVRRDILFEAKILCLDMIGLNRQKEMLDKRMRNAEELLALCEERLKAGDATIIEVNKIKMERMSIQTEALRNHAERRTALQSLAALNAGEPLSFEGKDYPSVPEIPDFDALCDDFLDRDAEVLAVEADARAAGNDLATIRREWWPRIEIGYHRNAGQGNKENGFVVGGSIPLFSNRRRVRMAQAQSVGTRLQADETRLRAEAALHSSFNELRRLEQAMSVYDQSLMAQTLGLLKEGVEGGELSVTDYFAETDQIYRNLQAYMELECQYHKTVAELYKSRL